MATRQKLYIFNICNNIRNDFIYSFRNRDHNNRRWILVRTIAFMSLLFPDIRQAKFTPTSERSQYPSTLTG